MPCSDTYAGPNAFSENETTAVDNFMKEHSSKFDSFLSLHSYSQLILFPYGHTTEKMVIHVKKNIRKLNLYNNFRITMMTCKQWD